MSELEAWLLVLICIGLWGLWWWQFSPRAIHRAVIRKMDANPEFGKSSDPEMRRAYQEWRRMNYE